MADKYLLFVPEANFIGCRFIEKYLLCQKCKYPETTMFIKQKKLMSKCRACGNENLLDGGHRAGTQLMKQLPKDMSEIDNKKDGAVDVKKDDEESKKGETAKEESDGDGKKEKKDKKDKKKKKKADAEEEEEPLQEEGIKLDSEEIGKYTFPTNKTN